MTLNYSAAVLKARREAIRWHLLAAVDLSRPVGIYTEALLPIVQSVYPDDLLAQRAGDDVIGDSHSGLLGLMLDQVFDARCHSCGDDR
jgi:hypothetical protein